MNNKPIFNSYLAKLLLQKGNKIVDLQQNRNKNNGVIFYFENTDKLKKDLDDLSK